MIRKGTAGPLISKIGFFNARGTISAATPLNTERVMFIENSNANYIKPPSNGLVINSIWWNTTNSSYLPLPAGCSIKQFIQLGDSIAGPWENVAEFEFPINPDNLDVGGYWHEGPPIIVKPEQTIRPIQMVFGAAVALTMQGIIKIGIEAQ